MASHAFHQLYYHIVWRTSSREPVIEDVQAQWFEEMICREAERRDATVLACRVMPEHVHLFVSLPPTVTLSTFIGEVKGVSAHHYNTNYRDRHHLRWQTGYGVVTVRKGEADRVIEYVRNQREIHAARKASRTLETTSVES